MNTKDHSRAYTLVKDRIGDAHPTWALILGSGWSVVLDAFSSEIDIPYADIPGLGQAGVQGHSGRLHLVRVGDSTGIVFAGRRHVYEGVGFGPVATPIFIAKSLGVRSILLTNAAGGINPDYVPGDLMIIEDHINMMGQSPLTGDHDPFWGPRFPDQSAVYEPALRQSMQAAANAAGHTLKQGTYLATPGPTYETPAEIRAFGRLGADAVGMSTVPEAILANAAGLRVGGLSCITNFAAGVSDQPLAHDEVLEVTERAKPKMGEVLSSICRHLAQEQVA